MHLDPHILTLVRNFLFSLRANGFVHEPQALAEQLGKSHNRTVSKEQVETAVRVLTVSGQVFSRETEHGKTLYWTKGRKRSDIPDKIIEYLERECGKATISRADLANEIKQNAQGVNSWLKFLLDSGVIRSEPAGRITTYYLIEEEVKVTQGPSLPPKSGEKEGGGKVVNARDIRHKVTIELKGLRIIIEPM